MFFTFNNNLLVLNQLVMLVISSFIFPNKTLMPLYEKKIFVFSAYMIGFSTFKVRYRLFAYNRNNNGPKIDFLRVIPHITVTLLVELYSIEINCFQTILDCSKKYCNTKLFFVNLMVNNVEHFR